HLPNMFWSEFWRCRKAIAQILVALTKDLKIKCQNKRGAAGIFRSFSEVFYEITVFHHIKLEPERLFGNSRHIFAVAAAHWGSSEGDTESFCGLSGQHFSVGVLHTRHAGGR